MEAVDSGDEQRFVPALGALTDEVRGAGEPVADDAFAPSDLVVPFADATSRRPRGCSPSREPTRPRTIIEEHPMSTARNIPADRGLTLRMFTTGLLLVILYGAVVGLLIAFGVPLAAVLVFAAIILFVQYWFSDKIALFGMGGRIVTPEQAPQLHGAIDRLCALADMKKPRVAIANTDVPNAFATGRSPNNAVVCATTGLMRRLDEPELEAVLAHELSHVAHRDVAVMTIASFLGMVAGLITRIMLWTGLLGGFGGGRNNSQGGQNVALIELGVLVVSVVVYAVSFLLTMALSRYRELAADRSGALLTGRPSALASALVKVTGDLARIPSRDLRAGESFNAFYFTPAIVKNGVSLSNLFSTHPSLDKRLAQLATIEAELGRAS
jgi:heat shock protein HtpX